MVFSASVMYTAPPYVVVMISVKLQEINLYNALDLLGVIDTEDPFLAMLFRNVVLDAMSRLDWISKKPP